MMQILTSFVLVTVNAVIITIRFLLSAKSLVCLSLAILASSRIFIRLLKLSSKQMKCLCAYRLKSVRHAETILQRLLLWRKTRKCMNFSASMVSSLFLPGCRGILPLLLLQVACRIRALRMSLFPRLIRKPLLRPSAHLLLNRIGSAKQRTSLNGNSPKQRTTKQKQSSGTRKRLDVSVPDDTTKKTNLKF